MFWLDGPKREWDIEDSWISHSSLMSHIAAFKQEGWHNVNGGMKIKKIKKAPRGEDVLLLHMQTTRVRAGDGQKVLEGVSHFNHRWCCCFYTFNHLLYKPCSITLINNDQWFMRFWIWRLVINHIDWFNDYLFLHWAVDCVKGFNQFPSAETVNQFI